jgi:hypothetical protein
VQAQEVFGVLRSETNGAPLEGVVVMAVRASDGEAVLRTLSGAGGAFRAVLPRDSVVVRALRIGEQPVELWRGRLGPGERIDIGRSLPRRPIVLTALNLRERSRCSAVMSDTGSATRTVFSAALTALNALIAGADDEAMHVRTAETEQYRDLRDRLERINAPRERVGTSADPFQSVPVGVLLEEGFAITDAAGTTTYRAPDARLLASDGFLRRYCLSLDRSREERGLLGVRFSPQSAPRDRVEVRGAVWLDNSTLELRHLEFGYVGLTQVAAATRPGGIVEYTRLADGRWIIDRWLLRMPRIVSELATVAGGTARVPRLRASGVRVVGGVLLEARRGEVLLYTSGGAPGAVVDPMAQEGDPKTMRSVRDQSTLRAAEIAEWSTGAACALDESGGAVVRGVVRRQDGAFVAGAAVEATWRGSRQRVAGHVLEWSTERAVALTDADGTFQLCGVPRDTRVELVVRTDGARLQRMQLRLPPDGGIGIVEITVAPSSKH